MDVIINIVYVSLKILKTHKSNWFDNVINNLFLSFYVIKVCACMCVDVHKDLRKKNIICLIFVFFSSNFQVRFFLFLANTGRSNHTRSISITVGHA